MLADTIKKARINHNLSQAELAKGLNVSQPMISAIEQGKKQIPADLIPKIPAVLNDAKTKAMMAYECGAEFFSVPLLLNVDDNPKNVLEVLIEEISEAIRSIQAIKKLLVNVKPGSTLPEGIKDQVYANEEQIADLYVALKMHFTTMDEAYGIKLNTVEDRVCRKLREKGYV